MIVNNGRMGGKAKVTADALALQVMSGGKVLVLYGETFPAHTYEALSNHPLCQEKDKRELRFASGAVITFQGNQERAKGFGDIIFMRNEDDHEPE